MTMLQVKETRTLRNEVEKRTGDRCRNLDPAGGGGRRKHANLQGPEKGCLLGLGATSCPPASRGSSQISKVCTKKGKRARPWKGYESSDARSLVCRPHHSHRAEQSPS